MSDGTIPDANNGKIMAASPTDAGCEIGHICHSCRDKETVYFITRESRRIAIQRCIQSLVHACQCKDANCKLPSCQKMKRVVVHIKRCCRKAIGGCPICKQLIALSCYHAKRCQEVKCMVPFCTQIKHKLRQHQLSQRLAHAQMLRQRMAARLRSRKAVRTMGF